MIQLNPFNRQTTNVNVELRTEPPQDEKKIKLLTNSIYYWIECAYLVFEKEGFRLRFYHIPGDIYFNKLYKTETEAKDAMDQYCRNRLRELNKDKDKAMEFPEMHWSPEIPPEKSWLEDRDKKEPFYYPGMHS
ncbi:MAG: hypothetical protein GY950_00165 [bacterium]|nr:hypothetical protein [bacterium]